MPSWSWACEGRASRWPKREEGHSVECKVLETWSETDNINPFGSISSAHLDIEGKLFSVSHPLLLINSEEDFSSFWAESSGANLGEWHLDFDPTKNGVATSTGEWENNGVIMFILTKKVYSDTKPPMETLSGLLLYPTECPNEYLRIGIFQKVCGFENNGSFNGSLLPDFLESAPYRRFRLI